MFNDSDPILDGIAAYGPFLARLTGVYTVPSGGQSGQNQYFFIEQSFDANGIPVDANPSRQTYPASGTPISSYALEVNNALLTVPGTTPVGYVNAGPYVEMRLKGVVGGVPVYEFTDTPLPPLAWVKVTASALTSVTLSGGGGTINARACLGSQLPSLPNSGVSGWCYNLSAALGTTTDVMPFEGWFLGYLYGTDNSGNPVWVCANPQQFIQDSTQPFSIRTPNGGSISLVPADTSTSSGTFTQGAVTYTYYLGSELQMSSAPYGNNGVWAGLQLLYVTWAGGLNDAYYLMVQSNFDGSPFFSGFAAMDGSGTPNLGGTGTNNLGDKFVGGVFISPGAGGASGTINYTKPGGASGTITVSGGLITGWT